MEVEEEHHGLWQALSIQKVLDKCVPRSTLKPSQVESVKWLPVPKPSVTWINHGPQTTGGRGCGGGDGRRDGVKRCDGRKRGRKFEEKDRVTRGSRCQSQLSRWRPAQATTPGHYFLAESKVNVSRPGCVCLHSCARACAAERPWASAGRAA